MDKRLRTVLTRARALIEKGWCTGVYAVDKDGIGCEIKSPHAVCFCAVGAICRAQHDTRSAGYYRFEGEKELEKYFDNNEVVLINYNDTHTKEQVLALFDRAISENNNAV